MPKYKSKIYSMMLLLIASAILLFISQHAIAGSNDEEIEPEIGEYLLIKKYPDHQTVRRGEAANFTIIVSNIDQEINLTTVVVQDLIAPDCNRFVGNLPANSNFPTYNCTLENIQKRLTNWATVEGTNPLDGEKDQARDAAIIDIIDISVEISAIPSTLPVPGGPVDFSVEIINSGSVSVALQSLTSLPFGDLTDPDNALIIDNSCLPEPTLPLLPPNEGFAECSFKASVQGEPSQYPVEVTAYAIDNKENSVIKSGKTIVEITDPIFHPIYIPYVEDTRDEPNNSCSNSFPIQNNLPYHFFPNDSDDWYYFDLPESGDVLVELSDFVPRFGQIIIYDGGTCNSLRTLKNNGNDRETKLVPLGIQPSARYYILVINAGEPNNKDPYKLQIHFQPK